jgi:hypothetical protein
MNFNPRELPWLTTELFENWRSFLADERAKSAGKRVAYSLDGKSILASGANDEEVRQQLLKAGLDPSKVVYGNVDPGDVGNL